MKAAFMKREDVSHTDSCLDYKVIYDTKISGKERKSKQCIRCISTWLI